MLRDFVRFLRDFLRFSRDNFKFLRATVSFYVIFSDFHVIISDFYDETDQLKDAFQHLRFKGHDLVAFQVLDQNELDFNFDDPVLLLEDAETQEQMPVLPDVVMIGYRARMRRHVEDMRECAAANHVDYELITTKQPLDYALFSFLSRRRDK